MASGRAVPLLDSDSAGLTAVDVPQAHLCTCAGDTGYAGSLWPECAAHDDSNDSFQGQTWPAAGLVSGCFVHAEQAVWLNR